MFSGSLRRISITTLLLASLIPGASALSNTSEWALDEVNVAEAVGLAPSAVVDSEATETMTRAEFCGIAVNAYKVLSGKAVFASGKKPFRDCTDLNVIAAYELGLINANQGYFYPDEPIKRQDICVMLYRVLDMSNVETFPTEIDVEAIGKFADIGAISEYAQQAMYVMADFDVIAGTQQGDQVFLTPDAPATREQALIMALRFCQAFAEEEIPLDFDTGYDVGYDDYLEALAREAEETQKTSTTQTTSVRKPEKIIYEYKSGSSSSYKSDPLFTEDEKMNMVYGIGGSKYTSAEEAEAHMTEITVPVWRLQEDGSKTTEFAYLTVNASLASIYRAIFNEIYSGSERFPIHDVGCYSWRTGEHSQGTAIDINPDENMEATINADGTLSPTCGTHWTPYLDPYSIPEGGDVYNAFTKYGFAWGGNAWQSKRDYMHFSYFGR